MPSLRSIATEYHRAANKIAARADKRGELTANQAAVIKSYRECAVKVEALIRPEDEAGALWSLEGDEPTFLGKVTGLKVTSADKAATPQELLEKTK